MVVGGAVEVVSGSMSRSLILTVATVREETCAPVESQVTVKQNMSLNCGITGSSNAYHL